MGLMIDSNQIFQATRLGNSSRVQKKGDFAAQLQAAASAQKTEDSAEISGMTYQQKLDYLQKLHESTDYNGMTVPERLKLIHDRFNEAGIPILAQTDGLFGAYTLSVSGTPIDSLHNKIMDTYFQQLEDVAEGYPLGDENLWREALYPGKSEEEIKNAIAEKYQDNSLLSRFTALSELNIMNIGDQYAIGCAQIDMKKMVDADGQYTTLAARSGDESAWMDSMTKNASNMKVYLSKMVDSIIAYYAPHNPDRLQNGLDELLDILKIK